MNPTLTELANKHGSDKGTTFGERHGCTLASEQLFAPLRDAPIRLLEIGLRYDPYYAEVDHAASPSLEMWLEYFPKAVVFGFDIKDFSAMQRDRLMIFRGDQGNPEDVQRLANEIGAIDIVIDDGSHASFHQQLSFAFLFPCVRTGGIYIFEDLHFQPPRLESLLPRVAKTREVFSSPVLHSFLEVAFFCNATLCAVRART